MFLSRYYDQAMDYTSYLTLLGEHHELHQLHSKRYHPSGFFLDKIKYIDRQRILAITEPWCSDSLAILPVMMNIVEVMPNWEIKILLRDEHPDLMDHYLTSGSRGIPIFIFLDDHYRELFRFGPRPAAAQHIFDEHRNAIHEGKIQKQEVIKMIRKFYALDRGKSIETELTGLLRNHLKQVPCDG